MTDTIISQSATFKPGNELTKTDEIFVTALESNVMSDMMAVPSVVITKISFAPITGSKMEQNYSNNLLFLKNISVNGA